jgi:FKBP-type peptidyl-prolyl cis-trans isomerase
VTVKFATTQAIILALVLSAGTAAAQQTPAAEKDQQQVPAVSQTQADTATSSKTEPASSAAKASNSAAIAAQSESETPTIRDRRDKISYAFGLDLARDLKRQKKDLNVDLLLRALRDSLADKPVLMTDDDVTAALKQLESEQKQDYEHARRMIAEKNRQAGEQFFSENAKKEGVVTLPSGLQYKILKKGEGRTPTLEDKVVCQYKGTLLDGTEFDNSVKRGHPITLPVKGIMPGWTQALQMMPVGSKWQLFIPPQLGYGDKIVNGIGPNATLVFEVEVVSIEEKAQTASAAK